MKQNEITKEIIARDIAEMLNSRVSDHAVKCLVRDTYSWRWSQQTSELGTAGKYEGCPYWSKKAVDLWITKRQVPKGEIIHEHVVPRSVLATKIVQLRDAKKTVSADEVFRLFDGCCLACIVLNHEDKTLPRNLKLSEFNSPWQRYVQTPEIVVGKVENSDPNTWRPLWAESSYDSSS